MNEIWVEKYRPKEFEEIINIPESIPGFVKKGGIPHLLFIGKAGVGKTTAAKVIISKLNSESIELNSSDERGIQTIREKVKLFSMKKSSELKIILLDEADGMTNDAQQSLRRIMEIYSEKTRFILTANYVQKIIEPLRSRCAVVEFSSPNRKEILDRIKYICDCEKIKFDEEDLKIIVDTYYPDIRKTINLLQFCIVDDKVNVDRINLSEEKFEASFQLIQKNKWKSYKMLRKLLKQYGIDYEALYSYLFNRIFELKDIDDDNKTEILIMIADRMYRHSMSADPEVNFMAGALEIGEKF